MKLHGIDVAIILVYLLLVTLIGILLKRRAARNLSSYLLGGKELPWYLLGLSNASGMFDISGTMWMVTILFVYGLKSVWLPWLWPSFNQIFLMVFLSAWLRRSNVTTGAQWIVSRFGSDRGARWSHSIVVVFAVINCLGMMAYGFVGLGKFIESFIPWEVVAPYVPFDVPAAQVPYVYGIAFTVVAVAYTILGGMTSIVLADVIQYLIMTVSAVIIAVIAMHALCVDHLVVPGGWHNPFFGWRLDIDWTGIINEANRQIADDKLSLFGIVMMLMLFKGVQASLAGPLPNYDMQKILATRNPREAALMSGFVSVVLVPVRYLLIAGFAVLALLYYHKLNLIVPAREGGGTVVDFEKILPSAINVFVPWGVKGCLVAGLLAAFLGTFAGTLNAAQAYLVNDLYVKHFRPNATSRQTTLVSYAVGLIVVAASILIGLSAESVTSLLQWIVSALYGSYVVSNVLKWYWWRFNGHGYFWGMVAGLVPALIFAAVLPKNVELYFFPLLFVTSLGGCLAGTYCSPPTEAATLISFYRSVRPWGFWRPIHALVIGQDPGFQKNTNFHRDVCNVIVGIIWQTALVMVPIFVVLLNWSAAILAGGIVLATMGILKKTWYDRLETA
jgi:SSS family solute:Na+ symporter